MKISRMRGLVAGAVLVLIIIGLATHTGTGTWSALGFDAIAAVCPLGILETMLGAKEVMLHPLILLAVAVVAIVLVGKAFCSWVCPVPWLRRFFRPEKKAKGAGGHEHASADGHAAKAGEHADTVSAGPAELAVGHKHAVAGSNEQAGKASCDHAACGSSSTCAGCAALAPVGGKRDGFQLDTRHFALLGALGSAAVFGFPVFCLVCPVGLIAMTLVGVWHLFGLGETTWGLVVAPIVLILEVVVLRKWCVKICPLSALMSLIATANRTFKPRVSKEACLREQGIDCHACVDACPELLDPHTRSIPECTKCGACVEACPAHAIKIGTGVGSAFQSTSWK